MRRSRPVDLEAFVERLHREWLVAGGGMTDEVADAVARALLPAQHRVDAADAESPENDRPRVKPR